MIFVFIESIIVFFIPTLGNSIMFSLIWAVLICGVANALLLFSFLARVSLSHHCILPFERLLTSVDHCSSRRSLHWVYLLWAACIRDTPQ